ncbi:MAG: PAS domain S-box protein, partial [Bacteroidota bacterium]|nr:PAS domain S-box protein [Bacteroidota bacterium]
HPKDYDSVVKELGISEKKCSNYHVFYRFRKNNDSYVYIEDNGIFLSDDNGKAVSMIGIMKDVSERKIAEKNLQESEQKFRVLTETLRAGVILYQNNKLMYVNKEVENITGYSQKELLEMNFWGFTHPDYLDIVMGRGKKRQAGDTKVITKYEFKIVTKEGAEKWIFISGNAIRFNDAPAAISSFIDITQRKKIENELRNSEKRFRSYFENSMIGMAITSLSKGWVEINDTVSVILGYSFEELKKMSWADITHPDDLKVDEDKFELLLADEINSYSLEKRFIRKSGESVWTQINISCVRKEDDSIDYIIALIEDISELVEYRNNLEKMVADRTKEVEKIQKSLVYLMEDVNETNSNLNRANINIEASNKELEAFSYSVSHDLRAPLTRMDGFSKVLLDMYKDKLDEQAVHYLNRIRSSSENMSNLISAMLSLSRLTRSKISRKQLDFSSLCNQVKENLEAAEPNRKLDFQVEENLKIYADEKFVRILLENLLGNAFKFTKKQQNPVIMIGKKIIKEKEVFFIQDNGDGFDMKYYHKIFTAFQRLHAEKEFEGTGIGLAIVQRIINKHGGEIWAESVQGKGATFYFSLA